MKGFIDQGRRVKDDGRRVEGLGEMVKRLTLKPGLLTLAAYNSAKILSKLEIAGK